VIETDLSDWERLPKGEIEISPVASWATAGTRDSVLLRLEIVTETGQIGWAQLAIPVEEAEELGRSLQWWATHARGIDASGTA